MSDQPGEPGASGEKRPPLSPRDAGDTNAAAERATLILARKSWAALGALALLVSISALAIGGYLWVNDIRERVDDVTDGHEDLRGSTATLENQLQEFGNELADLREVADAGVDTLSQIQSDQAEDRLRLRELALLVVQLANSDALSVNLDDASGSAHLNDIELATTLGLVAPCSDEPGQPKQFCPAATVKRGEVADGIARLLRLRATSVNYYGDDDGSIHEAAINALTAAGLPPFACGDGSFCPEGTLTREEIANILVHVLRLDTATSDDYSTDDESSPYEDDINALGATEITFGCNPPSNTEFCPGEAATREQWASFLIRSLLNAVLL